MAPRQEFAEALISRLLAVVAHEMLDAPVAPAMSGPLPVVKEAVSTPADEPAGVGAVERHFMVRI